MDNIKIYRFFAVNKKASLYVFNKVNEGNKKLDKLAKEYIKKYSDTNLFDKAAKREKNLHYLIFKDNKYVGEIYFDILRYFKQLYINFIHIDPNYQRQGLSKILFNYVVNDVKANFKKIKTIQGYPTSIEGKYFLESTGFIPDVYYCSSGSKGQYSVYYLNEKDTFVLDQKEYELVCGDTYNYRVNGVKKYNELGEDGLKDGRGRPSSNVNKELSIEEKQAIEIERLKKELERQKMINEVLKKTWKFANVWKRILTC